jgi:hypothetical protein
LADIRKTGEIPGVGPDGALVVGREEIVVLNLEARLPRDELKSCASKASLISAETFYAAARCRSKTMTARTSTPADPPRSSEPS